MKLHIKNMVSKSCKMIVKNELDTIGLGYKSIVLGEVEMQEIPTKEEYRRLKAALSKFDMELMVNKKAMLIERIKNTIIDMVHYADELPRVKYSNYISEKINHDYTYLANVFSNETGMTIEHYIINHKIERVKELIRYDELNLTEISYLLNYSSVAHLSRQFKQVTGLTASFFRNAPLENRIALENV
ncbi:AraC-like DNA-binding protein [Pedobacter sp. UYP30]|uniref:helix-turn-helix domain-containing protein n=1 Tax=Pedobacter sp. UYP30 TaxID=1756400 RepID=UPI0033978415